MGGKAGGGGRSRGAGAGAGGAGATPTQADYYALPEQEANNLYYSRVGKYSDQAVREIERLYPTKGQESYVKRNRDADTREVLFQAIIEAQLHGRQGVEAMYKDGVRKLNERREFSSPQIARMTERQDKISEIRLKYLKKILDNTPQHITRPEREFDRSNQRISSAF